MPPRLALHGLRFGHRGRALGEAVDLQLHAGEAVCVLGPNGCGKTTLFRTVLGLIPALQGRVEVDGRDIGAEDREAVARRVAYVPQAQPGGFAYRVEDVVLMGRAVHVGRWSMPSRDDRRIAGEALERLGVAHLAGRPFTEISGGERQLVLIARALAQQAPLIVMDEPTASLDFGNQRRVLREIAALKAQGVAMLLSTHQPEHALRLADRVMLMARAGARATGTPRGVMTPDALAGLYGVDADEVRRSVPGLPSTLDSVDFGAIYRAHVQAHGRSGKTSAAWDGRAREYGRHSGRSAYVDAFLSRIDLSDAKSLLDVGCGPGTMAIALARRLEHVVALDHSQTMLEQLREKADAANVGNIQLVHRAWEEPWPEVPVCDVAIASRSMNVADLEACIDKLHCHARRRIYVTVPAHPSTIDPEILEAAGARVPQTPDLLVLLGLLRQRGTWPNLDIIETPSRLAGCRDFGEFVERLEWTAGKLDAPALDRLRGWYDADAARAASGGAPMRWALVSWTVPLLVEDKDDSHQQRRD